MDERSREDERLLGGFPDDGSLSPSTRFDEFHAQHLVDEDDGSPPRPRPRARASASSPSPPAPAVVVVVVARCRGRRGDVPALSAIPSAPARGGSLGFVLPRHATPSARRVVAAAAEPPPHAALVQLRVRPHDAHVVEILRHRATGAS